MSPKSAPPPPPRAPLRSPVRWLLTPDVFGYLKQSLLHAFYDGELDPRDWMRIEDGHAHVEDASLAPGFERPLATTAIEAPASGELWFDYCADTGDGGVAMYTVGYLCQADLAIAGGAGHDRSALIGRPLVVPPGSAAAVADLALPRGQFLFVGGDTAYHVADEATIAARVQGPFTRAAEDLATVQPGLTPRRVYGIPGNHDYYDQLIGFGRMFRHPVTLEGRPGPRGRLPRLSIPNLVRTQEASYVAIQLPWDWQLWGLDLNAWLDTRQEWYFRSLPASAKLIVATPSPPIVHHAVLIDPAHRDGFERLELPPLYDGGAPAPGTCRLDLSGDTHHYARYEPDPPPAAARTEVGKGCATAQTEAAPYLAVVSGGGGAFHHPSYVAVGDLEPQATYPTPAVSRQAVARRLFNPLQLLGGGFIWIIPFMLALVLGTGATRSEGTRWFGDHALTALGITAEAPLGGGPRRTIAPADPAELVGSLRYLGFGAAGLALLALAVRTRGVRFSPAQRRRPGLLDRGLGHRDNRIRRYLTYLLVVSGLILPFTSPFFIESPLADALWFDGGWLAILVFAFGTNVVLGLIGGAEHRGLARVGFIVLGLAHAVVQTVTPFFVTRIVLVRWWLAPAMLAVLAVGAVLGRLTMARGARPWALSMIALTAWLAALAVVVVGADGAAVYPRGDGDLLLVLAIGAALAIASSIVHLGWYMAIAGVAGGHPNEVGGAARLDDFRQFIRFRLTPDRLTGYVIACDHPRADGTRLEPYLVDVFELGPRPAPPP